MSLPACSDCAELVEELEPAEIDARRLRADPQTRSRAKRHREREQPAHEVVGRLLQRRPLAVGVAAESVLPIPDRREARIRALGVEGGYTHVVPGAALILLEHHWAVPLRDAIARAGGFRIGDGFISPLDLVEIGLLSAEEAKEHHLLETAAVPTPH